MARKKKAAPPEKLTPTLPVLTPRRLMFDITPSGLVREPFRKTHAGAWRKLRRDRIKTGNLACDLCGAHEDVPGHLHLHEVYGYPNRETVSSCAGSATTRSTMTARARSPGSPGGMNAWRIIAS
jgi:hypothetical protein